MESIPVDTLRIIDANLNRIGEGLRVLEEMARMSLNDTSLTQQLKNMRHEIGQVDAELQPRLLRARDSEGDVGADMEVPGEERQRDMPSIIAANARRVQEALRVMEEIARTPGLNLDTEKYRRTRFSLYTVEKRLLSGMLRQDKIERLKGLYVIVDTAALKGRSHVEVAAQAIRGGVKVIQLRDKEHRKKELLAMAQEMKDLCSEQEALFIMNDYLDIALAVDADGLHLGPDDLPVATARRLLPIDKILGCSARTVEKATVAQSEGADYIGVGAMYPTTTKERAEVVGPGRLKEIRKAVARPLVAIGGINKDNVREVMGAGADAVGVISAILGAGDVEGETRQLVNIIEGEHLEKSGLNFRADT
jgi:thiamine-phosphate pyrophosphorylase